MTVSVYDEDDGLASALEGVADALGADGVQSEPAGPEALQFTIAGDWTELSGLVASHPEVSALVFSLALDIEVAAAHVARVRELLSLVNERLWLGHLDLWPNEDTIVFRHTLLIPGREQASDEEISMSLAAGVSAMDRLFPALKLVIEDGAGPEAALASCLFETDGEA